MAIRKLFLFLLAGILILMACASGTKAQSNFGALLEGFTADSFNATGEAVTALATSGEARGATLIEALQDGRLFFTRSPALVYYKDVQGVLFDAVTGQPQAANPDDLRPVRLNNRLRGIVATAIGTLTLLSPDPEKRLSAVQSVFKSKDPQVLPALDKALAVEKNAAIKTAMEQARAAIVALDANAPEAARVNAFGVLKSRGDQDSLTILERAAASSEGNVQSQAAAAAASIKSVLALWNIAQNIWYGLSLGSVLLLAAIGLAITFGVMGIINMAHGEMVMIGAYVTFMVQGLLQIYAPALFNLSLLFAVPLAFLVTGLIGILIERSIIRFLYGRPLETLLATFGLSLILQQLVRTIFGANNREVSSPPFMSGTFELGGLSITYGRMWIILFALAVFAGLQLLLRRSSFGLQMRAVTQNRRMASAMGINTSKVDALAFGLGSGIAGIAGVALSQVDNVSPNLGQGYIIDSFMVVVFGGVGNLWGTLVAAFTLGIANKILEPVAGAVLAKIALLVFIILFIQKRPRGLFAQKGRAVEA